MHETGNDHDFKNHGRFLFSNMGSLPQIQTTRFHK